MINSAHWKGFALLQDRASTMTSRRTSITSLSLIKKSRRQRPGKHHVHPCPTERWRASKLSQPRRKSGESVDARASSQRRALWDHRLALGLA